MIIIDCLKLDCCCVHLVVSNWPLWCSLCVWLITHLSIRFEPDPVHEFCCVELDVFCSCSSSTGTARGSLRNTFWTSAWCRPTKRSKVPLSTLDDHMAHFDWGWNGEDSFILFQSEQRQELSVRLAWWSKQVLSNKCNTKRDDLMKSLNHLFAHSFPRWRATAYWNLPWPIDENNKRTDLLKLELPGRVAGGFILMWTLVCHFHDIIFLCGLHF